MLWQNSHTNFYLYLNGDWFHRMTYTACVTGYHCLSCDNLPILLNTPKKIFETK